MINVVEYKNLKYIEWTVEIPKNDCVMLSPHFIAQNIPWRLRFQTGNKESIKFFTDLRFVGYEDASLHFDCNKRLQSPITMTIRIFSKTSTLFLESLSFENPHQRIWRCLGSEVQGSLLTIEIIIHAASSKENTLSGEPQLSSDFCFDRLSQDFDKMFIEGFNHDAEIKCKSHSWKVHKNVLSLRSKVFHAMFNSDMIEGHTSIITLQEIDELALQHFLRYLYCGKLPKMDVETAKQLYEIGDKYAVECLKEYCKNFLLNNLIPENSCEILILADQHSDLNFKESVVNYLLKIKIVLNDRIWQDFCKCYPLIALQVYDQYCKRN